MDAFDRVEVELERLDKTKKWLADRLSVSGVVLNHWKTRGIPSAKFKLLAYELGISREYLEGDSEHRGERPAGVTVSDPLKEEIETELQKLSQRDTAIALNFLRSLNIK